MVIQVSKRIEDLVTPIIKSMGYELWGIELCKSGRWTILRIYIDAALGNEHGGITIDDCTLVSKQIGALLEVERVIAGSYNLEVSSPGINRLLFKVEHYQQYMGSLISVYLQQPKDSQRKFVGNIHAIFANKLELMINNEVVAFELANINKAKLSL